MKNANLKALTFQYDNYHALGDKENYNFYVKKFRKLVDEYQVSPFKKIEFELDIINKEDEANLYIKEKKIIDIIKNLSEIMYADFVKIEYASDALVFNFEKKLELLAYRAYSQILLQTGRKLQAYEILKDQIDFYESLRDKMIMKF